MQGEALPVAKSARRHGIGDGDMHHALEYAVDIVDLDDLVMFIGPARDGSILEVGVSTIEPRIVHADMPDPSS